MRLCTLATFVAGRLRIRLASCGKSAILIVVIVMFVSSRMVSAGSVLFVKVAVGEFLIASCWSVLKVCPLKLVK